MLLFLFPFALGSELLSKTMDEIRPETLTGWHVLAQNKLKRIKYVTRMRVTYFIRP